MAWSLFLQYQCSSPFNKIIKFNFHAGIFAIDTQSQKPRKLPPKKIFHFFICIDACD